MKNRIFALVWLVCGIFSGSSVFSQPVGQVYSRMPDVSGVPPNVRTISARPAVMLNMSRDHQLFFRAYNEFSDYNGDDLPDGGYIHDVANPYIGYFDAGKCYTHDGTKFVPSRLADSSNWCDGRTWSGNFLNWATMTRIDILKKVLYGGDRSIDLKGQTVLRRANLPMDAHSFAKYYKPSGAAGFPALSKITPYPDSDGEITICNTTVDGNSAWSNSTTKPPLMRVVKGNYAFWAAHERRQCRWYEERTVWDEPGGDNRMDPAISSASKDYPNRPWAAGYGDFSVLVQVCKPPMTDGDRCKKYPNGDWKPVGLLQEFGEKDQAEFGLMTGSFTNNIRGGILRKNVSSFRNELDPATGIFNPGVNGIVSTLNKLRIFGYRYSDGTYRDDPNDGDNTFCEFQTIGLTNGRCRSWGNPIGEMFIESLRYFKAGGLKPSVDYGNNSDDVGANFLGLPSNVPWVDPFRVRSAADDVFGKPHCRSINIINFNASINSYDGDTVGPFSDLVGFGSGLSSYIDDIGASEGIHGGKWFVGVNPVIQDNLCTAKLIQNLSAVEGLCPFAPGYHGSFSLAGAAYWAHTHSLRPAVTTGPQEFLDPNFRVNAHSVALAPGVPRIEAVAPGGKRVVIQPSYRNHDPSKNKFNGTGTLVDFRVMTATPTNGKYIAIWEDSEQGGDYDQDVVGTIEWVIVGNTIQVTTQIHGESVGNLAAQGFGYTISGTDKDGAHFHSGVYGFQYSDMTGQISCQSLNPQSGCDKYDPATTARYQILGGAAGVLQDPLYWAAKWGGFTISSATDKPDIPSKWDVRKGNGNLGSDGVPDNYSLVFNPTQLEGALRRAFGAVFFASNAAPAVSASQLNTGVKKYVVEFKGDDPVSGDVKAFSLDSQGNFNSAPDWALGSKLTNLPANGRQVISNFNQSGVEFAWSAIGGSYQAVLAASMGGDSSQARALVEYMRGDRSNEGAGYQWRPRLNNILGPVVNTTAWVQMPPSAAYYDSDFSGYFAFASAHAKRPEILWVASNDGMLHAAKAADGTPVISFVPGALAPRLNEQVMSKQGVIPFVDGSPFTGDVQLGTNPVGGASNGAWKTYLFGSLGRGGRAFYALDVTDSTNLNASQAADIFKWQFTSADDSDLGYVLSDYAVNKASRQASPIVKLNNGQFAIVTGNGYNSTDGNAALMMIPVDGPDASGSWAGRYYKVVADAAGGNGLSTPTWVDIDNNGTADFVYAGDLNGNLWKFDISSTSPSNWGVAFSGGNCGVSSSCKALYADPSAATQLPIMAAPEVSFPAAMGGPMTTGYMVTFGTGASFDDRQFPRVDLTHRIYSIWDRPSFDFVVPPAKKRPLPRGTGTLLARVYTRSGTDVTVASGAAIDYANPVDTLAQDGWYVDLPGDSEMVVANPFRMTQYMFVTSIRPNASTNSCSGLPDATLYMFNPVSGLPTVNLFGEQSGKPVVGISIGDQKVAFALDKSGRSATYGGALPSSSGRYVKFRVMGSGGSNGAAATDLVGQLPDVDARLQWREIPGLRTR